MFERRITAPAAAPGPDWLPKYATFIVLGGFILVLPAWFGAGLVGHFLASPAVAATDASISAAIRALASPAAVEAMSWLSRAHGTAGILAMSALVAAWLARRSQHALLPVLLASVPGGLFLNFAVKNALQRVRPDSLHAAERLASFSFPSGHTAGATLLYGLIVVLLRPGCGSVALRAGLIVAAATMIVLVAVSRVMLGVHFPSDCAAAVIEGLLWLAICRVAARAATA